VNEVKGWDVDLVMSRGEKLSGGFIEYDGIFSK
jgi:hypothetical protein